MGLEAHSLTASLPAGAGKPPKHARTHRTDHYEAEGVAEVWLVDGVVEVVLVFRRSRSGQRSRASARRAEQGGEYKGPRD